MKRFQQSILYLALATLLFGLSFGCKPPEPKFDTSGRKIIKVTEQKTVAPFETREIEGTEYRVSRDPIGQFGGSFFTASLGRGPKTFNPLVSNDASSGEVAGLMFVGLLEGDPYTGKMIPYLAKDYKILPDKRTYIVTLRKGLKWSDNKPLTADDVVFTWNKIIKQGLGNPSTRDVITIDGQLPTVEKLDKLTIRFTTPTAFAPFLQSLSSQILPKHVVEPIIRKSPSKFDSFWGADADPKSFVVNGPFILEEYTSGQRIRLKRNPNYFVVNSKNQHLPYLDYYVIDYVQDENAALLQFEQNRLDTLGVSAQQVYYMRHLQGVNFKILDLGPSSTTNFLTLNLNPRKNKTTAKPYVEPKVSKWLRDLNFRKALDYSLDRNEFVMNILMGVGQPLFTAEGLPSIYLNPELKKGHPRNLEKAKALLKKSGFKWNNKNQLLDAKNNLVELELITNAGNQVREATAVALKNQLAEIGVKVNVKMMDFNVLLARVGASEWQMMVLGLTGGATEPHNGSNVWKSDAALHMMNQRKPDTDLAGSDIKEPWETELDQLFNQGAKEVTFEKRKPYYYRYQQVIYDNALMLYLYTTNSIVAVRNRVQNLDPTPLGLFHNLDSIWVKSK